MIDKRKNVCYVIDVFYQRAGEDRSVKVISQHSNTSRRFKAFMEHYFKNVFPVNKAKRGRSDGTLSSQWTVSWEEWPNVKEEVLEGITEAEKCY